MKLLTKKQKAKELNISTRTLDRWILKGKIKYVHKTTKKMSKRKWFTPEPVSEI